MAPSPQGQSHTQPQARLLLPELMSYYREISFPVCAASQGLWAPFTFTFYPPRPPGPCLPFSALDPQVALNSSVQLPPHPA